MSTEQKRRSAAAYYVKNRAAIRAKQKAWADANRETKKARALAYYAANRERVLAQAKIAYHANPDIARRAARRRYAKRGGWAAGEFERAEQARPHVTGCSVCGKTTRSRHGWDADHCHDTGSWRGFTCSSCNVRLTRAALADKGLLSPKEIAYLSVSECEHCRETYG